MKDDQLNSERLRDNSYLKPNLGKDFKTERKGIIESMRDIDEDCFMDNFPFFLWVIRDFALELKDA